jgi:hypothetical protein
VKLGILLAGMSTCVLARAELWSDDDPATGGAKMALSDYDLELQAEYRAIGWHTNALDLGEQKVSLLEHRLRLEAALTDPSDLGLVVSADLADSVLWGTKSALAGDPAWWFGERGGLWRAGVGYLGTGDRRDPDSYGLVSLSAEPLVLRRLYGHVPTPVGVFRLGRQPVAEGHSILYADGQGRPNRFGHGGIGVFADGLSLTSNLGAGLDSLAQVAADRGVSITTYLYRLATGSPALAEDDVTLGGIRLRLVAPLPNTDQYFDALAEATYGWCARFGTETATLRAGLELRSAEFGTAGETVYVTGQSDEIASFWAALTGEPPTRQRLEQWGARVVARWDEPVWTAYLELDYASSDGNPSAESRLTQFYFAPDARVGLLLFPRVLAYQSARSRAALTFQLADLGTPSTASQRMSTEGSFTNALAVFPQFDLRLLETLLLRWGVLAAWAPEGVVDPLRSHQSGGQGNRVNYRGGRPGRFYGVEVDGRLSWRPFQRFMVDLEGALLTPGDALADANGQASASVLAQGRATFAF